MILLSSEHCSNEHTDSPVSPLNAMWYGQLERRMRLPALGHIMLVYPMGSERIVCGDAVLENDQYVILRSGLQEHLSVVRSAPPAMATTQVLIIFLSPDFIMEMASFLNIPMDFQALLSGIPLPKGDALSESVQLLVQTIKNKGDAEDWFMDIVGQILRRLKLRHEALLALDDLRDATVQDLVPRLMQARQFIEANHLDTITTQLVADYVLLSQYHFARLFKTAFGITVHQFVMCLRLARACHLLEEGEHSVTDIALTVGYRSLSAFIHAFGKNYGMSPSAYRQDNQRWKS